MPSYRTNRMSEAIRANQQSEDPSLVPIEGYYPADLLCRALGISRSALSYHVRGKPSKPKRLRPFKKAGDNAHYFTPIEVYRFLLVNGMMVPRCILLAIENYNAAFGSDYWNQFKDLFQSIASGQNKPEELLTLPEIPNHHPKLSSGKYSKTDRNSDPMETDESHEPTPDPLDALVQTVRDEP